MTIAWKRKGGVASETALTSGETVKSGVLTVNQNKLAAAASGMITYICYISYYDSETKNTINITADITYTLVKNAANATSETLTVSGSDIINIQSYRCTMTYGGKNYVDVITVEDKSDPYVSEMLSIGGYTVKNNLGGVVPYVIVRTNQKEVDSLLGSISETTPSAPKSGDFWYKIDHTEKSVTLMKYNGTSWISASEKQSLTYTWYDFYGK